MNSNSETRFRQGDFRPRGMLANPHVQSILTSGPWRRAAVRRRARDYLARSRTEIVDAGSGVRLLGHRNRPVGDNRRDALVILLHGWEGSADSNYLLSTAAALDRAGFDSFRLNFRDHGPSHHLNRGLFHSCLLDEVLNAVTRLAADYRDGPVFLVGFSLGGNFALRVARNAGRTGVDLERVIAVSPVIRPARVLDALENGFPLYHAYFFRKWRRSLELKQSLYPEDYDFSGSDQLRGLRGLTDYLVRHYTDMPGLEAYLEGYSVAGDYLVGLETPTLIITAADDPIIPFEDFRDLPAVPALELEVTVGGGHCGFLENWRLGCWVEKRIENELCKRLNTSS